MIDNRIYFAQRAAEEAARAEAAGDATARSAHCRLQRAYLEKALVGDRPHPVDEEIG